MRTRVTPCFSNGSGSPPNRSGVHFGGKATIVKLQELHWAGDHADSLALVARENTTGAIADIGLRTDLNGPWQSVARRLRAPSRSLKTYARLVVFSLENRSIQSGLNLFSHHGIDYAR